MYQYVFLLIMSFEGGLCPIPCGRLSEVQNDDDNDVDDEVWWYIYYFWQCKFLVGIICVKYFQYNIHLNWNSIVKTEFLLVSCIFWNHWSSYQRSSVPRLSLGTTDLATSMGTIYLWMDHRNLARIYKS